VIIKWRYCKWLAETLRGQRGRERKERERMCAGEEKFQVREQWCEERRDYNGLCVPACIYPRGCTVS
jgi:hypothetical protein